MKQVMSVTQLIVNDIAVQIEALAKTQNMIVGIQITPKIKESGVEYLLNASTLGGTVL